jgi:hypothetical protein
MKPWVLLVPFACSSLAEAGQFHLLLGPPSLGQGGSNPVSFPPLNPVDWQLTWLSDQKTEWVFSLIPGFFYGRRFYQGSFYAALGGGLLITPSGVGVGVDHAYGYESQPFLRNFRLQFEYRQIIGMAKYGWQFPYTFRIGVSYAM